MVDQVVSTQHGCLDMDRDMYHRSFVVWGVLVVVVFIVAVVLLCIVCLSCLSFGLLSLFFLYLSHCFFFSFSDH